MTSTTAESTANDNNNNDDNMNDDSNDTKEKDHKEEEERLRERLKRRQEGRRNSDAHPEEKKDDRRRRSTSSSSNSHHHAGHDRHHHRGPPPPQQQQQHGNHHGHHHRHDHRGGGGGPPGYRGGGPQRGNNNNNNNGPPGYFRGPGHHGRGGPPGYYRGGGNGPPPSRQRRRSRSASSGRSRRSCSSSSSRSRRRRRSRSPYSSDDDSFDSRSGSSRSSRSSSRGSSDDDDSDVDRKKKQPRSSDDNMKDDEDDLDDVADSALTKDQRTVFVSQLVMRADERDVKRYFIKLLHCKVNEVVILRDKRSGRHKGCAYVELGRLSDVSKALEANNAPPDFQRFPILIKGSEAEKNYIVSSSQTTLTAKQMGARGPLSGPLINEFNGKLLEAQKVYLGNLDPTVSQKILYSVFSQFGHLEKVSVQMDPSVGASRGFCFLSYRDPKDANLAIQTMAGQVLAGRPLKTGWANQTATVPGVEVVMSTEFPDDATARIQSAHLILSQVSGGRTVPATAAATAIQALAAAGSGTAAAPTAAIPQVPAIAAIPASSPPLPDAKIIGNANDPTNMLLIRNMFDKDEETDAGWSEDIRLDFCEESSKWGTVTQAIVMDKEPGGKIYASFETTVQAQTCASNLAGRWFDKRQLRVEFIKELPKTEAAAPPQVAA